MIRAAPPGVPVDLVLARPDCSAPRAPSARRATRWRTRRTPLTRRRSGESQPARGRAPRARLLGQRQDVRRLGRVPRGRASNGVERVRLLRRPAVRERPAALRAPADRLRQGRGAALPDHARPAGRAPLRLGLSRPAGRGRGREAARPVHQGRDPRARRRPVQRGLPRLGPASTPRTGSATSPGRPAGSTSPTTTRRSICPTWRASCGRSRPCTTRV